MIEHIGVDRILVETDFPHPTCLYPGGRERFAKVLSGLDDASCRRVLRDNATELYQLVPALIS